MTNNNENEATGTNELSEGVAHKIGVEMYLWRKKNVTIYRQHLLVLEEYIIQMEKIIASMNGGSGIPAKDCYALAEDIVHDRAMKEATYKVMNQ